MPTAITQEYDQLRSDWLQRHPQAYPVLPQITLTRPTRSAPTEEQTRGRRTEAFAHFLNRRETLR